MSDLFDAEKFFQRYRQARNECGQDVILLFRIGDYYEAFDGDAHTVASLIGLTITQRTDPATGIQHANAGFVCWILEEYLGKLVRAGHRAAVIEQVLAQRSDGTG